MTRRFIPTLKYINTGLLLIILMLNFYTIGVPFFPGLFERPVAAKSPHITSSLLPLRAAQAPKPAQANQLIIPVMGLDEQIHEGNDTYAELDKGVWRWPASSTPDKGSNTVLLGHRFTYTQPRGVFYFLNLVKTGDEVDVVWNNVSYAYRVDNVKVVSPDHTEILNPTTLPTVTIYTCTPTWWPKDRLVVTAHLEKQS